MKYNYTYTEQATKFKPEVRVSWESESRADFEVISEFMDRIASAYEREGFAVAKDKNRPLVVGNLVSEAYALTVGDTTKCLTMSYINE